MRRLLQKWSGAIRSYLGFREGERASLRDRLLITIGTLAIVWYFASIILVSCSDRSVVITTNSDGSGSSIRRVSSKIPVVPFLYAVSYPLPEELVNFMAFSITTISGTLATYLGMVLGFGQVQDKLNNPNQAIPAAVTTQIKEALPVVSPIQNLAAWCYVASLVLALFLWAYKPGGLDETVVSLGRSILGLFGGVLAVVLNVPQQPNARQGP